MGSILLILTKNLLFKKIIKKEIFPFALWLNNICS